jgi:O-antigen ligase
MEAIAGPDVRLHPPSRLGIVVLAAAASVVVLGTIAVYSPKYAVGTVVGAGVVLLAFRRLALAVGIFVILTFPEHLPGSLGVGATVAKPFGVILAVAWLAGLVVRRGEVRLLTRDVPALAWTVIALVALAATSSIWAQNVSQVLYDFSRLVQVALLLFIVYTAASTAAGFRTVVWAFLVGSVATAGYSIATGGYAATGRLSGIFDPNYFAARLIPAILVACFIALTTRSGRVRAAAAAVLAMDVVAFALTQSRGGIIGLAVALLAGVALSGSARPRVVAAVLVAFALGTGYYFVAAPTHLRSSFSTSLSGASAGRSDEWRIALRMFSNHPLSGVGLGNYIVVEPTYATQTLNVTHVQYIATDRLIAHSTYLEVAAELGLGGVALFVAILGIAAIRGGRGLVLGTHALGDLQFCARGLLAGAVGMFVAYIFLSAEYEKDLWLVLGLLVGVGTIGMRNLASARPEEHMARSESLRNRDLRRA